MTMFNFEFSFSGMTRANEPVILPMSIDTDGEEIARDAHEAFNAAMWEAFKLSRSGSEKDVSVSWGILEDGALNQIGIDPRAKHMIETFAFDFSKIDLYRISNLSVID